MKNKERIRHLSQHTTYDHLSFYAVLDTTKKEIIKFQRADEGKLTFMVVENNVCSRTYLCE